MDKYVILTEKRFLFWTWWVNIYKDNRTFYQLSDAIRAESQIQGYTYFTKTKIERV